jgi:hypothetical protein
METARFFEKLDFTNQSKRRLNPEKHHHNRHHRENLKSHAVVNLFTDWIIACSTHRHRVY